MKASRKISEQPMSKPVYAELSRFAQRTQLELAFDAKGQSAKAIVDWVDSIVFRWQKTGKTPPKKFVSLEDLPSLLGFTWGEQIVVSCGWRWVSLTFHEHDDWQGFAIVSRDRSRMIMPFAFIHQCINENVDVTIAASLAALQSNVLPEFPPKSYSDIMRGLMRIVPRV